jgi:uncharacterized protein
VRNEQLHAYGEWLRAAVLSLGGLMVVAAGYLISACFLVAALHKPFAPASVGLWHFGDEFSLRLGFGASPIPANASELLGWWLIPAGILAGSAGVRSMNKLAAAIMQSELSFGATHIRGTGFFESLGSWLRANRTACLEIGLVCALLAADRAHLVPVSNTPFLLALAWISLRMRGLSWRTVGFSRPESWSRALAIGIAAGFALECFSLLVTEPLIGWATGTLPDRSDMRPVIGSPLMLGIALALNWTLAAFGEEMAWRGYLLNRILGLGFRGVSGPLLSLLLTSALFGIAHGESQGVGGMIQEGFAGLMLGSLYFAFGRKLAIPIIAHGASNSLALVLIYCNRYPGL